MFSADVVAGGPGTVLRFRGELDFESVVQFQEAAAAVFAGGAVPELVVVDCAGLEFCDSSGISELVRFYLRLTDAGSRLRMSAVPASVARAFELTGLDRAIPVYDSTGAALADVTQGNACARPGAGEEDGVVREGRAG